MSHAATRFGITALATWRVTHLLAEEDGPAEVVLRMRTAVGASTAGALMDCFQCLSLWVALPFAGVVSPASARDRWTVWLALSGAACLLERGFATKIGEDEDGLLWEGTQGAQNGGAPAGARATAGAGPVRTGEVGDPAGAAGVDERAGRQPAAAPPFNGRDGLPRRAAAASRSSRLTTAE